MFGSMSKVKRGVGKVPVPTLFLNDIASSCNCNVHEMVGGRKPDTDMESGQ